MLIILFLYIYVYIMIRNWIVNGVSVLWIYFCGFIVYIWKINFVKYVVFSLLIYLKVKELFGLIFSFVDVERN